MSEIKKLDARHLLCPMPVIKTQQAIADMQVGDTLVVYCTDPGVEHDIPAWVRVHGHKLVKLVHSDDEIQLEIEVCDN